MPSGYWGKILRVNLSQKILSVEEPEENFYRRYFGGRGFISYYLLRELKPKIDPLSEENKLIFAAGVVSGAPIGGSGRNSVGAKSPLTGAYGDAEVGGYWGAELKHAGYDAIIFEGKSPSPVYLLIENGQAELRDARKLWGKTTAEAASLLQQEIGEDIRTALIGPGGERCVRYACIINDLAHAAGRTGMGAVMGAKNLKGIAVRGSQPLEMAQPEVVASLARWLGKNAPRLAGGLHRLGTPSVLSFLNREGGLPTRNFQQGSFEGAKSISAEAMRDSILVGPGQCYACPVFCKRKVAFDEPYQVDPIYGGPEYEALASLGSNLGIDDLKAIAKGNELCNAYSLDTISTGAVIALAMECFERGIINQKDTDGIELRFGSAEAMLKLIEMIAHREGVGDLLAEGMVATTRKWGKEAEKYAFEVKGQPLPMHEPRYKQGMGLGYAISPTGADHCHNIHDNLFSSPGPRFESVQALGILEPLPIDDLSPAKVRLLIYSLYWAHFLDCLVFCSFVPLDYEQMNQLVRAVTGWNTTTWELMKVGERVMAMTRLFNLRERIGRETDRLPQRFFTPFESGPLKGVGIDQRDFEIALDNFYLMMGWDKERGMPTLSKLQELDIEWAADLLSGEP